MINVQYGVLAISPFSKIGNVIFLFLGIPIAYMGTNSENNNNPHPTHNLFKKELV